MARSRAGDAGAHVRSWRQSPQEREREREKEEKRERGCSGAHVRSWRQSSGPQKRGGQRRILQYASPGCKGTLQRLQWFTGGFTVFYRGFYSNLQRVVQCSTEDFRVFCRGLNCVLKRAVQTATESYRELYSALQSAPSPRLVGLRAACRPCCSASMQQQQGMFSELIPQGSSECVFVTMPLGVL